MDCREFEDKVAAYIEGTLHGEPLDEMDRHRASCPACARLAELHEAMFAAFNSSEPVRAPEGLADKILAAAEAEEAAAAPNIIPFPTGTHRAITCETFEQQVVAFVDGTLDTERAKEMARHRELCTTCARVAQLHETVAAALDTAEPFPVPYGLAQKIIESAELEASQATVRNRFRLFERLTAAIAGTGSLIAAMVMITGFIWSKLATEQIWFDRLYGQAQAFFPMLYAALVSVLPAQWIATLNTLSAPVQLPFVTEAIPVYYLAPMLLLAPVIWHYLHASPDEAFAAQRM